MLQSDALELLKLGKNVFLTGAAGAGKTYVLRQYIDYLRDSSVAIAITASTGIAATHLGGVTVHSWSGIGIREELTDDEINFILSERRTVRRIQGAKVLILDEISMLHAFQLDMVERITRIARGGGEPFGGLQVIVCGDFFQLPPVSKGQTPVVFAFDAVAWNAAKFTVCYLHEQHRQGTDLLIGVLNDIRAGVGGEPAKVPLRTRYRREPEVSSGIRPTILYARNVNVDTVNDRSLAALSGVECTFPMITTGSPPLVAGLLKSCLAPEFLRLKIGAQVMFVKNSPLGHYVNGTRGVVSSFGADGGFPIIRTTNGTEVSAEPVTWEIEDQGLVRASITQVPLRLAWAITIHKSQGMTLDAAEMDLSDTFEPGMGYVALSRVRNLASLKLLGLNDMALRVNDVVLGRDTQFRRSSLSSEKELKEKPILEIKEEQHRILQNRFEGASLKLREKSSTGANPAEKVGDRKQKKKNETYEITRTLLEEELSLEEIASRRDLTVGTIISHLGRLHAQQRLPRISYLESTIPKDEIAEIYSEFKRSTDGHLGPIFEALGGKYPYEMLRLAQVLYMAYNNHEESH